VKRSELSHLIQFLVDHITHTEFLGTENIPTQGGIIVATNHNSRADAPLLMLTPTRPDIYALATTKYQRYPLFKWILDTAGVIWIDRERADFGAMRSSLDFIKNGGALGIAPEGTRSQAGTLQAGKPGTVLLADKAKVLIVPVGIAGSEDLFRKLKRFQKARITIRFGKPFSLPPIDRDDREGWLKNCTEEIMCRIAAELPPAYRGFYADHERLKQLVA
jgi:1-acyl-sn-glycerol-3-phosphate acyltransferase